MKRLPKSLPLWQSKFRPRWTLRRRLAATPTQIIIQPGNNLWKLSRQIYGKGIMYTVIYEANKDQIRKPELIYPGQIFLTPEAAAATSGQ